MKISGYRWMWVIVMFDLPVDTKLARKHYTRFRKGLICDGFAQMQYSVYTRNASSRENAAVHVSRVEKMIPPNGEVRVLTITDKQMERMDVFWGNTRKPPESAPTQLSFF
tara:strand:+ start:10485 stop:10814 length:330 start_codon:yes stop_codon:yes gene_type:complete